MADRRARGAVGRMRPIQWLVMGERGGEALVVGGFFAEGAAEAFAASGVLDGEPVILPAFAAWQIEGEHG